MAAVTSDFPPLPGPGWYRDPYDRDQVRRWDGATWTSEVRPAAAAQKPTGRSFAIAVPMGIAAGIVLSGIVIRRSTEPAAYALGQSTALGAIAGLGAAVLTYVAPFKWRWWYFPPVIVAAWFMLFGLSTLQDSPTASGRSTERVELVAPTKVGALELVKVPDLEARRATVERLMRERVGELDSVVIGPYAVPGGKVTMVFTGLNLAPGSDFDDETTNSPARAVLNYLAGAGIKDREYVEPGRLGGAMMCGPGVMESVEVYVCAWATVGVLGSVAFADDIEPDEATHLTHDLRELAEHAS